MPVDHVIYRHLVPAGLIAVAVLAVARCSPQQIVTFQQQLLGEADSLFKAGNYEYAKIRYTKVRDDYPKTRAGRKAQYNLGFINVYYENPFSNWEAALREFKTFAVMFPEDDLTPVVNTWIRMLVVLQSFSREYDVSMEEVDQIRKKAQDEISEARRTKWERTHEILLEATRRCHVEKDSLSAKIRVLEEVIESIENAP